MHPIFFLLTSSSYSLSSSSCSSSSSSSSSCSLLFSIDNLQLDVSWHPGLRHPVLGLRNHLLGLVVYRLVPLLLSLVDHLVTHLLLDVLHDHLIKHLLLPILDVLHELQVEKAKKNAPK